MKNLFRIALAVPFFALIACGDTNETNTAEDETNDVVDQTNEVEEETNTVEEEAPEMSKEAELLAYIDEKGWDAQKHKSGLYYVIDEPGEGDARPGLMDEVTIFYQGYLLDGHKFDGTGETPASFPLYQLISGWQIGIPLFGKGGKGKLIIPSDLAYGDRDNRDIPGGSTLMFEIELIDWQSTEDM